MASEEIRKKWGTIFMGDREASVEQLHAMQEPLRREKEKKEQTEDYMERVRARAADRAREILGAAYTERQKVLDEAKAEIAARKRQAAMECAQLKQEGEKVRQEAQAEYDKAKATLEEAEKIRAQAHEEGFQEGMTQAGAELHEFRAELGQSMAVLMRAIERERKNILEQWRTELAALVQAAAQAGTGLILQKEHQAILRALVFQALDLLESRSSINMRVNPADEAQVSDLFHAARERAPELKQWVVTGDNNIEPGGLVAETGSGSVDLQRNNFRELVDGVLSHLGLPDMETEEQAATMRDLVEKEVAHIASLSPELDLAPEPELPQPESQLPEPEPAPAEIEADAAPEAAENAQEPDQADEAESGQESGSEMSDPMEAMPEQPAPAAPQSANPTLEELEEELFPLDMETPEPVQEDREETAAEPEPAEAAQATAEVIEPADPETLAKGGFL